MSIAKATTARRGRSSAGPGRRRRRRVLYRSLIGGLLVGLGSVLAASCGSSTPSSSPKTAEQLVAAGLAAEKAGNSDQAFTDFEAAAAQDPSNKYAAYDLGYIYQVRGDTTDAAAQYQKALTLDPKFAQALYNLGVLDEKSNPTAAISYFEQELQADPTDPGGNFDLGVLLIQHGQTPQGDTYLQNAIRLDPSLASDLPSGITLPPPTTTTTTRPR
jgi:tetratricopeptide (TPR) repeat protein